jgi:hypothetical protein
MDDEDTIELELTPEQIAVLMRAATPERPVAAPIELIPLRSTPPPPRRRPFEVQLRAIRVPAIVTIAVFAISLSGMKYVAMSREQEVPLAPSPPPAMPSAPEVPLPTPAIPSAEPVHFTNPFDDSEVFDFPAGTSDDEARAAVAELLIERARDRLHLPRAH